MNTKIPHTFVIVFFLILISASLTWIVPAGQYTRETVHTGTEKKEVIQPDSFHFTEQNPQSWQVFSALFKGFVNKSDILIFVFIMGGAFCVLNGSKAIDVGIFAFLSNLKGLQRHAIFKRVNINAIILSLIMLMFSLFGAVFGMSEETIPFVVIFVPLAISMGYDSIVGVSICYLAAHVGFSGAMLNPFTIGIAQAIAGIPIFSGIEYRFLCWVILTSFAIVFILFYAAKIKRNPHLSPVYKLDSYWRKKAKEQTAEAVQYYTPKIAWFVGSIIWFVMLYVAVLYPSSTLSIGNNLLTFPVYPFFCSLFFVLGLFSLRKSVHFFILNLLLFTLLFLIVGVLSYHWYLIEISALFLAMGLSAGLSASFSANQISELFIEGAKDMLSAVLIIGLASGILFILEEGKVIDTLLYGLSKSMMGLGETVSLGMMYTFQTILNLILPSGSAKAALTMPIMSPFADLIGISRQTTVLAFQFGDGFTNMITPVSGVLLACLSMAKIPYTIWLRWIWKFILAMILVGFLLMLPTLFFHINGF